MRIYGYSADGRYALVIGTENVRVHAVDRDGRVNPHGRWECSVQHLADYDEVYRGRFPVRDEGASQ